VELELGFGFNSEIESSPEVELLSFSSHLTTTERLPSGSVISSMVGVHVGPDADELEDDSNPVPHISSEKYGPPTMSCISES
jgi:hypothetical protein